MTLIVPDNGLADPSTTGSELNDFQRNLDVTRQNVDDLAGRVGTVKEAVEFTKSALEQVEEIHKQADQFLSTIKGMQFTLKVTGKVGPLKLPSETLKIVLDKLETLATHVTYRAGQLAKKIKDGDYVDKLQSAEDKLSSLEDSLEATEGKLDDYETGVFNTRFALGVGGAALDPLETALNNASTPVNDVLVPLNTAYMSVTDKLDDLTGIFDAPSAPNLSVFDPLTTLASKFGAINGSLEFLKGPLSAVHSALKPVEWALDAVQVVYDVTVGPVIDWVLDKLGITAIMDRIADAITNALPIDLDGVLNEVTGQVDAVFNQIEGFIGTVSVPGWDTEIDDIITGITDDVVNVFDAVSTTEMRFGSEGNDTLEGRDGSTDVLIGLAGNDEVRGAPTGGTASDALDIFIASAGNDTLYGSGNTNDWLILPGLLDDWVVSRFSSTAPFVFYHKDGKWGYEVAYDIENFAFYDGSYTAATLEALGIITSGITNGDDLVVGGTGNDLIAPLDGSDTVDGGDGVDTYLIPVDQLSAGVIDIRLDSARTDGAGITYQGYAFSSNDVDYLNNFENAISQRNVETELFGTDGDNLLISDNSDDYLVGKGGDDQLLGHGGRDFLRGDAGSDSVFGGAENDTLLGGPALAGETNFYDGGSGRDRLVYDTNVSNYNLRPPNETIVQGSLPVSGPLRIFADTGTIQHMSMDLSTVIATDTARNIEEYVGSNNNDTLRGAMVEPGEVLVLDGGSGEDLIYTDGATAVRGGTGQDTIVATVSGVAVDGGTSSGDLDELDLTQLSNVRWKINNTFGPTYQVTGVREYEVETLTDAEDGGDTGAQVTVVYQATMSRIEILRLGDQNDEFYNGGVSDIEVLGGAGDDFLAAKQGNGATQEVTLRGEAGDDYIDIRYVGGEAYGGDGDDEFFVEANNPDMIFDGGAGDDFFLVSRLYNGTSSARPELIGGDGWDRASFQRPSGGSSQMTNVYVNLVTGEFVSGQSTTTGIRVHNGLISGFEEIIAPLDRRGTLLGSDNGERLVGLGGADYLDGKGGNDELFGNDNNDTIIGGSGDDRIHGGLGNDSIDGGQQIDTDTVLYTNARIGTIRGEQISGNFGSVIVDLDAGRSSGVFGNDTLSNIDNVVGSMGDDRISGDNNANVLSGGQGDDTLEGKGGNDILTPGEGRDVMFGGWGSDRFMVGPGSSIIFGGAGTDIVDLSAVETDLVLNLANTDFSVPLTISTPVWADTGTEEGRVFNGVTITPSDVLETAVENANSADDLTRVLPETADYDADPTLPSFEIVFEERVETQVIETTGVEGVSGGQGDDRITGSAKDDWIEGGAGNDTIEGGDGADNISGGAGDDVIHGGTIAGAGSNGPSTPIDMVDLNTTATDARLQTAPFNAMPAGALTLEILVKRASLQGADESPFSYAVQNSTNELSIFTSGTPSSGVSPTLRLIVNGTVLDTSIPADAIYDNQLHRLSFTLDSATGDVAMFLDGLKVWSDTGVAAVMTPLTNGGTLILGQDQDGITPGGGFDPNQAFEGQVGDLRIFDAVLSDALIKARAFETNLADPASVPNLVGYWTADATAGTFGSAISPDMTEQGALSYVTETPPTNGSFEVLDGGSGNDTITASSGVNSSLYGGGDDDLLIASSDGVTFYDDTGDDTMVGGAGTDYFILSGPNSGADVLELGAGGGYDFVYDFDVAMDRLDVRSMGFTQVQIDAIAAAAVENSTSFGVNTVVDFGNGTEVEFAGMTRAELQQVLANGAPNTLVEDQIVGLNQWVRLVDVMDVYDQNLDELQAIRLWDDEGGNSWWADGGYVDASNGYLTTNVSDVWFRGDATSGSQELWTIGNDGQEWGTWASFNLVSNALPTVTIGDQKLVAGAEAVLGDVMTVADADDPMPTRFELRDVDGGSTWYVNDLVVDASEGHVIENEDLQRVTFRADSTPGTQTLEVRAWDGRSWGNWTAFDVTANAPSVAVIDDQEVLPDGWRRLSDVLGVTDADGDAPVSYYLWDTQGGNNWWVGGDFETAVGGYIVDSIEDVWFQGENTPGTQTLRIQVNDGLEWGPWTSFDLETRLNTAPSATVADQTALPNQWRLLSDVLSFADADGDPLQRLELWDDEGGNNWWADGGFVDAATGYETADPGDVWFRSDAAPGTQTLFLRGFDGLNWSAWEAFDLETRLNTAPSTTVADQTALPNQWRLLSDVLIVTDADGDPLQRLEMWDDEGGNNWWADGGFVDASTGYETTDPGDVWFRSDAAPGTQTLFLRGFDGLNWSAWEAFDLETRLNTAPSATVADQTALPNQWRLLSDVLSFTDADGDPLQRLELWDDEGGNNWWADGGYVDAATGYETSDPGDVWFRGDAAPGTQTLFLRGFDGLNWSAWDAFDLETA